MDLPPGKGRARRPQSRAWEHGRGWCCVSSHRVCAEWGPRTLWSVLMGGCRDGSVGGFANTPLCFSGHRWPPPSPMALGQGGWQVQGGSSVAPRVELRVAFVLSLLHEHIRLCSGSRGHSVRGATCRPGGTPQRRGVFFFLVLTMNTGNPPAAAGGPSRGTGLRALFLPGEGGTEKPGVFGLRLEET